MALSIHELFVDRAASQVLFLLFLRGLLGDVEEIFRLFVVYDV